MESEQRKALTEKVQYDMPKASKERVDAIVFRQMYEEKHI